MLIGKGADVNIISGQGFSALHQAVMGDQPEIAKEKTDIQDEIII